MSQDETSLRFGRAVAAVRAELGMKRKELAERAGLSYPYIAEIENGSKSPSQRALANVADALGMTASELMERAEQLPSSLDARSTREDLVDAVAFAVAPSSRLDADDLETTLVVAAVTRSLDELISRWARTELPALVARELSRLREGRE
jgi:transcriptional regulator with XRE-family HTH domain